MPNILKWSDSQEQAFISLKKLICSRPILQIPDMHNKFYLQCDASDDGMGAVILQDCEGKLLPVEYASKKFLPREKSYSTIEKECFAIQWSVNYFQKYL